MRISYAHICIPSISSFPAQPLPYRDARVLRCKPSWCEERTTCRHCGGPAVVERFTQTVPGQMPQAMATIRCDTAVLSDSRNRTGTYREPRWQPKCPVYTIPG